MLVAAQNNGQSFSKDMMVAGQEGSVFFEGQVDDRRLATKGLPAPRSARAGGRVDDIRLTIERLPALCSARAGERVDDIRLTTEGLPALCSG